MVIENCTVERWINEDPKIKDYIHKAQNLYRGPILFVRNGRKTFHAKLNCAKLHGCSKAEEAYFELDLNNKRNGTYKNFFYLKIITIDGNVNTIKLF